MKTKPICPYCDRTATLVTGAKIYPEKVSLRNKWYWICYSCTSYVGCHNNTTTPLGNLANKDLRRYKARTHSYFDPLWKSKSMSRTHAYKELALHLNMPINKCHIGLFSEEQCQKTIDWAIETMPEGLRMEVMFEGYTK